MNDSEEVQQSLALLKLAIRIIHERFLHGPSQTTNNNKRVEFLPYISDKWEYTVENDASNDSLWKYKNIKRNFCLIAIYV